MTVSWDSGWGKKKEAAAMNALTEWAHVCATECRHQCPVDKGTLRASIGVERNDSEKCVYIGCGGAAKAYALRQHQDASLGHTVGKSHFISDPVYMLSEKIPEYIKKSL